MKSQMIIPNHLQVEVFNGACSARCIMCGIDKWTRKLNRMTENEFEAILKKFIPHISRLDFLTLHGCGEVLFDKGLPEKIVIAKRLGFRGTGFATNCTELNPVLSKRLIESGLDTIICSVDGIKKETHEAIRRQTVFKDVVDNIKEFIRIRDSISGNTRVLVRFIRQELNYEEWPAFYDEWNKRISRQKGDDVIRFDVHNWGKDHVRQADKKQPFNPQDPLICSYLFERLIIYSNGQASFCCADDNGFFDLGSVLEADPIEIYNNELFSKYRKYMQEGRIWELEHCKDCTVPFAKLQRTNPQVMKTG